MKLLHFSDIHAGCFPKGCSWLFDKRLLGTMSHFLRRRVRQHFEVMESLMSVVQENRPDWIICTGDLTAVSAPQEFDDAIRLLMPLREAVNGRFIYLPGNHDAYIDNANAAKALSRAKTALNGMSAAECHLALERRIGNVRLFFVDGACPMPPWRSAGHLTDELLEMLKKLLEEKRKPAEIRLMVSHFPIYDQDGGRFSWRRRLDGDLLLRDFAEKGLVDGMLCGHIHFPYKYEIGRFKQICAGAATLSRSAVLIKTAENTRSISAHFLKL